MVVTVRKIRGAVLSTRANGTATITGTGQACAVFSFAFGAEQIEQAWRGFLALSGWMWMACTVPMARTMATQSTDTTPLHHP